MQLDIQNLKSLLKEGALKKQQSDYCSETETEGGNSLANTSGSSASQESLSSAKSRSSVPSHKEEIDEDAPLASLLRLSKSSAKIKTSKLDSHVERNNLSSSLAQVSSRDLNESCDAQHQVGRKRVRVVLSDDEADDTGKMNGPERRFVRSSTEYISADRGW